jgi:hypothetical protein
MAEDSERKQPASTGLAASTEVLRPAQTAVLRMTGLVMTLSAADAGGAGTTPR